MKKELSVELKNKKGVFTGDFSQVNEEVVNGNNIVGVYFTSNGIMFNFSNAPQIKSDILEKIEQEPPEKKKFVGGEDQLMGEIYEVFIPDIAMDFFKENVHKDPGIKRTLQQTLDFAVGIGLAKLGKAYLAKKSGLSDEELEAHIDERVSQIDPNDPDITGEAKKLIDKINENKMKRATTTKVIEVDVNDKEDFEKKIQELRDLLGL